MELSHFPCREITEKCGSTIHKSLSSVIGKVPNAAQASAKNGLLVFPGNRVKTPATTVTVRFKDFWPITIAFASNADHNPESLCSSKGVPNCAEAFANGSSLESKVSTLDSDLS
jgi:hypothetical protein